MRQAKPATSLSFARLSRVTIVSRWSVVAVLFAAACGSPTTTTTQGATDDTGGAVDVSNVTDGNAGTDGVSSDLAKTDSGATDKDGVAGDCSAPGSCDQPDVPDSTGGPTCEFPANPKAGEAGATCATASDCDSGVCLDGPSGKICTQACTNCCPSGFKCEPYGSGTDVITVCVFKQKALCRPCATDAECAGLSKDALCVAYGDATAGTLSGGFCGAACDTDGQCPSGYACKDAQGEKGAGKQCVKTTGECACSPQAIADGAQTTCAIKNGEGTCSAVRKCSASGLSACTAATPAAETCGNQTDDNCNGTTDEDGAQGCTTVWSDGDGDADGKLGSASKCMCTPAGLFTATTATDCDDANKAVNGATAEVCDGIDNNCDGKTDEGCDDDGDGWCDVGMVVVGDPVVCPKGKKDCDDTNVGTNPGASEICGNFIDDNCDGQTDAGADVNGAVPFYADNDGDGYGTGEPKSQCGAVGVYSAVKTGDCADNDPLINPGADELCSNQKDDNCNNLVDEANAKGCTNYYVDVDLDGVGAATPTCLCAPDATFTVTVGGDCADNDKSVNPNATETCNGVDDDCDGMTDELNALGCKNYYIDLDGDKFGNPATALCLCGKNALATTTDNSDCNDEDAEVHPGAVEKCDGVDNDCNAKTDEENAAGCSPYYVDGDGDTYGDPSKSSCLCAAGPVFKASKGDDCDDADATVHPGAKEFCGDGVDNNCVNGVDEAGALGCNTFYRDHDVDGYGVTADSQCLCAAGGEYTADKNGDCNDSDKDIKPKATEVCDGKDNDCDGATDPVNADGCTLWYVDADGDNYGTFFKPSKCVCEGLAGYANQAGDCADGDATVNPGATEICDGKDNDCDQIKDPPGTQGCTLYFLDSDGDKFGITGVTQCTCAATGAFSATAGGDCDDSKPAINPGQTEVCNGIDDNCDTQTDEGLIFTYYTDNDGDGYGLTATGVNLCGPDATHKVATPGDCDDTKIGVNPAAAEACNGVDDNCNGNTDEGLQTTVYYLDSDADGYGTGSGIQQCGPVGSFSASVAGDCDDAVKATHPNATETCNNIDDNCNAATDEGIPTANYYQDLDGDGYGSAVVNVQCGPSGLFTRLLGGDCNDSNVSINPSVAEVCGDSLDNNCDGTVDEGCGSCAPTTLASFEDQSTAGWTLTGSTPGWAIFAPGLSGSGYALAVSDVANVRGYTPLVASSPFSSSTKHTTATKSFTVAAWSKVLTITVDWEPYLQITNGFSGNTAKGIDPSATLDVTFQGLKVTLNSATTPGLNTINFLLPTVPQTPTSMSVKFDFYQGHGIFDFNTYAVDTSALVAVDNIRITCP